MELHSPTVRKSQTVAHCNEKQSLKVQTQNAAQIQSVPVCKADHSVETVCYQTVCYEEEVPSFVHCSQNQMLLSMPTEDINLTEPVSIYIMPELIVETVSYETTQYEESLPGFSYIPAVIEDYCTIKNNYPADRKMHGDALWSMIRQITVSSTRYATQWSDRLLTASIPWDPGIKGRKSHSDNILNMLTA